MKQHQIRALSLEEMKTIHRKYMRMDFPPNELRPYHSIRSLHRQGRYRGVGLFDGESLLAYAFFASVTPEEGTHYLLDYLAVAPERRDSGLGTELLSRIAPVLPRARSIVIEVENPDLAANPAEQEVRSRRLGFYLRNGIRDTGVKTNTFGVDFLILEILVTRAHTPSEIGRIYGEIYRSFLPDTVFRRQVKVLLPEGEDVP